MGAVYRSLHICFSTIAYPPDVDGFATYTRDLAVCLVKLGQLVTVICASRDNAPLSGDEESMDSGVRVIRLGALENTSEKALRRLSGLSQLARSYKIYVALRKYHGESPFDIIEFSNWHAPGVVHSVRKLAPQVMRVTTSICQVASDSDTSTGKLLTQIREWYALHKLRFLEAFSVRRSDLIVAPSYRHWVTTAAQYGINPRFNKRLALVPFGIDVSYGSAQPPAVKDSRSCRLLFLGRLSRRKGFDVFMAALPDIFAKAKVAIYVTVIGEDVTGPEGASVWLSASAKLDEELRGRIQYLGRVTDAEREENYRHCDVFVAPSRYESFGLMYVEAMSHGIPVVGCAVGGVPDVINQGITGLLVEPDHAGHLAKAVLQLVNDPTLRGQMGEAGKASATARFTRERMAEATLDAYRALLFEPSV